MNRAQAEYETVPYRGGAFPDTHPGHLAALGLLFGMEPAAVGHCRVLELGCGAGVNLLPMASLLPAGRFVGLDLSRVHIAQAQADAQAAGLTNVTLHAADILDYDPDTESFDYIIAHGLFSWVSDEVKERILQICGRALKPSGIAYISYNCYPGWSQRRALCDLLRLRTAGVDGFEARTRAAWAALDFVDAAMGTLSTPHAVMTRDIIESMRKKDPNVFFHDELGEVNDPCYLLQFVEWAAEHGLQYLGDAMLSTMLYENLPDAVRPAFESLRLDHLQAEQFMDFLRNRMFRCTLLCRQDVPLERRIRIESFGRLRIRSMMTLPDPLDLRPGVRLRFVSRAGHGVASDEPFTKAFLIYLTEHAPRFVPFAEAEAAAALCGAPGARERLLQLALDLLAKDLVRVSTFGVDLPPELPARPRCTPLARTQAQRGPSAVNLLHELLPLTEPQCAALRRMNGTDDQDPFDALALRELHAAAFTLPSQGERG